MSVPQKPIFMVMERPVDLSVGLLENSIDDLRVALEFNRPDMEHGSSLWYAALRVEDAEDLMRRIAAVVTEIKDANADEAA